MITTARLNLKITKLRAKYDAIVAARAKHAALCSDLFADLFEADGDAHARALKCSEARMTIAGARWGAALRRRA